MHMAATKNPARRGRPRKRSATKRRTPIRYADLPELEWIALTNDGIVAHAPKLKDLVRIVDEQHAGETVVFSRVFPRGPAIW